MPDYKVKKKTLNGGKDNSKKAESKKEKKVKKIGKKLPS